MIDEDDRSEMRVEFAARLVASYVANNPLPISELTTFIRMVDASFVACGRRTEVDTPPIPLKPAVPIKRSIFDDFIICLEDGKKFKSLKRHLMTHFGMTPDEYRRKWG